MEENNTTTPSSKPSYEQLEQVALHFQQRAIQAERKLDTINMTTLRLDYLFKVLDKSTFFSDKFVVDCTDEITDLLEVKKEKEKEDDSFIDSSKE